MEKREWNCPEFELCTSQIDVVPCCLQGYRTGYPYRCPALRDKGKKYSDVENASSAHGGYSYGEDSDSGARSPLKHSFQRGQRDKTRWVNAGGRPDEPYEDGPDGGSPKSKPKVWTNITHDHVKPLLQSLSSGVCVPSCITNCLVCAYLIVHSIDITATLLAAGGRHLEIQGTQRRRSCLIILQSCLQTKNSFPTFNTQ